MTSSQLAVHAFIGFGSNLGEPNQNLEFACKRIGDLPRTRLLCRSALYQSAPIGVGEQPDYYNAVLRIETRLAPLTLLEAILAIEVEGGRTRPFALAPRTLDLDLLLYADQLVQEPELIVPHPRMHERAFVLVPLAELDPALSIPGLGPLADLLPSVAEQRIERISA